MNIINKENYKDVVKNVNKIIIEADPLNLISGGAPENEYEGEVNKIILNLKNIKSENDIFQIVEKVFNESFDDMNIDQKTIKDISEKIKKYFDLQNRKNSKI